MHTEQGGLHWHPLMGTVGHRIDENTGGKGQASIDVDSIIGTTCCRWQREGESFLSGFAGVELQRYPGEMRINALENLGIIEYDSSSLKTLWVPRLVCVKILFSLRKILISITSGKLIHENSSQYRI